MTAFLPSLPPGRRLRARSLAAFAAFVLPIAFGPPAVAATFSVGPGATCTHDTLQAAVDAAAANPGADTIRIVRNATWTAQAISTNTEHELDIIGGVIACTHAEPDGKTTLSGEGGNARSVLALRGGGIFRLHNLIIRDGDQAGDDDGGGIHFQGNGIVEIHNSEIVDNAAEDGGGIYAHGTAPTAQLIIGADVIIVGNTARRHGGGIAARDIRLTMIEPGSMLMSNVAAGHGGGLFLVAGERDAHAYIGSNGVAGLGAVYDNRAAVGGGIATTIDEDEEDNVFLQVFSTVSDVPVRIAGNHATQRGGAIDLQPRYSPGITGFPGYPHGAIAYLRNVDISGNTAPVGAAINLAHDNYGPLGASAMGAIVQFNAAFRDGHMHAAAAPCPVGAPCGFIRDNSTVNTTGAILHLSEDAGFTASRIAMQGNQGGWLMYLSGEERTSTWLDNSLVARNTVEHALIRDDQDQDDSDALLNLHHLTFVGNTIGANGVLSVNEDMHLTRSTIDQPGKTLFATDVGSSGGNRVVEYSLVSALPTPAGASYAPSRYVDAANGDYMPRAGAAAVDWAPAMGDADLDLHSRPRAVDLEPNGNTFGPSDVGAFERPALPPLVLNADFAEDLHFWFGTGDFSWDGTQDVNGASDSGSLRVPMPSEVDGKRAKALAGPMQCVHVPGPGTYYLNGSGRVMPSGTPLAGNRASLVWELRADGGAESCASGIPSVSGVHLLSDTGQWTRPDTAAEIVVTPALWTPNTSITIRFDLAGSPINAPTGWFDAITLGLDGDAPVPGTFSDGFE